MRIWQQAGASNTGRKRRHNEDAYVCDPPLFAVADGMGGARAGEVASSLAADVLREAHGQLSESAESDIARLVEDANRRVHERALRDADAAGMGTTMTVAFFQPHGRVVFGHVGDSRAYLLRDGRLVQLTDDHSLVAELVRRGELSVEQAEVHPQRSVITRALGTDPDVAVDLFSVDARDHDIFLLCSDGLTTMVDTDTISDLLERHRYDLSAACRALITAANDRGGDDNITAVLFAVTSLESDAVGGSVAASRPALDDDEDTLHPGEVPLPAYETVGEQTVIGLLPPRELPSEPERVKPPLARLLLAQILIVVLAALVIVLVVKGFAQ